MTEKRSKKKFFYTLICTFLFFLILCRLVSLFFPLVNIGGKNKIPYGAFGLTVSTMTAKVEGRPRIILLGNSVWQTTPVIDQLIDLNKTHRHDWEIGNFSLSGSSIFDQILQYGLIKKFHPDLVIFHLNACSFGCAMPLYRTSVKDLIFEKELRPYLLSPAILQSLKAEEISFAFLSYLNRGTYYLELTRIELKSRLNQKLRQHGWPPFFDFFPYQMVFAGLDEEQMQKQAHLFLTSQEQYTLAQSGLEFLIHQLIQDGQKAMFIEQENSLGKNSVTAQFQALFLHKKGILLFNNRDFFDPQKFSDEFHPKDIFAAEMAHRLEGQIELSLKTP